LNRLINSERLADIASLLLKYNKGEDMTEGEFIRFYKNRNKIKSHKEVREKIDLFWDVLFEALKKDKKVIFKEWGVFEKREIKSRKIKVPMWEEERYTEPKKVIKFRAGKSLIEIANGDIDE